MKEYFTGTPAQAVIVPQYADTVKVPVASWDEALKIQGNPSCNGEVLVYDKTGKLLGRWAESISGGFTVSNGDSYPKNTWGQPQKMRAYKSWKEKVAAIR